MNSKALVEVYEVIQHLSLNDYNKIPNEIKEAIYECMDKNYIWKYDKTKKIKEQNLEKDTRCMLAYLNLKYLLNKEQKIKARNIYIANEIKVRNKTEEQIKVNDLFSKKLHNEKVKEDKYLLPSTEKNLFFSKLLYKIKKFLFHK